MSNCYENMNLALWSEYTKNISVAYGFAELIFHEILHPYSELSTAPQISVRWLLS